MENMNLVIILYCLNVPDAFAEPSRGQRQGVGEYKCNLGICLSVAAPAPRSQHKSCFLMITVYDSRVHKAQWSQY